MSARPDVSSPCLRGHHDGCTAPSACECDCHYPDEIVWEEPAARGRLPMLTEAQKAALQKHPKRWARVKEFKAATSANGAASKHKKGMIGLPLAEWEFAGRKVEGGSALYARFIGRPS